MRKNSEEVLHRPVFLNYSDLKGEMHLLMKLQVNLKLKVVHYLARDGVL